VERRRCRACASTAITLSLPLTCHSQVQAARAFHQELTQMTVDEGEGCGGNCSRVVDWIEAKMKMLDHVDAYRHEFLDTRAGVERTNVYGILRASPLADGKVRCLPPRVLKSC